MQRLVAIVATVASIALVPAIALAQNPDQGGTGEQKIIPGKPAKPAKPAMAPQKPETAVPPGQKPMTAQPAPEPPKAVPAQKEPPKPATAETPQPKPQRAAAPPAKPAPAKVTTEQQTKIREVVKTVHVTRVEHVDFNINVGVAVPRTVRFYPLPPEVVEIVPEYSGYEFFVVGNQLIIVDPESLQIVAILPA